MEREIATPSRRLTNNLERERLAHPPSTLATRLRCFQNVCNCLTEGACLVARSTFFGIFSRSLLDFSGDFSINSFFFPSRNFLSLRTLIFSRFSGLESKVAVLRDSYADFFILAGKLLLLFSFSSLFFRMETILRRKGSI